jgi:tetratricopeptide (TPR) repeat protein
LGSSCQSTAGQICLLLTAGLYFPLDSDQIVHHKFTTGSWAAYNCFANTKEGKMSLIRWVCLGCGAPLHVADDWSWGECLQCKTKYSLDKQNQDALTKYIELGQGYLQAQNYDEAYAAFSRALEQNPRSGDAWLWKGIAAILKNSFAEGDTYWRKSTFTPEATIDQLSRLFGEWGNAQILLAISDYAYSYPHWEEILLQASARISPLTTAKNCIEKFDQVVWRAKNYNELHNAVIYLERALSIDKNIEKEAASMYLTLARVALRINLPVEYYKNIDLFLENGLRLDTNAKEEVAELYLRLAVFNPGTDSNRNIEHVSRYLEKALKANSAIKDKVISEYINYGNSIRAYDEGVLQDKDFSLQKLEKCAQRVLQLGPMSNEEFYWGYAVLAEVALSKGQFEKAENNLQKAFPYAEEKVSAAYAYIYLAKVAVQKGNHHLAKNYLKKARGLGAKKEAQDAAKKLGIFLGWF